MSSARKYYSILEKLVARGRGGLKKNLPSEVGLRRTRRILERVLGDDGLERLGSVIHVVGTNGKGSVAWKTSNTLYHTGMCERVGLYTSPHLFSVRERIRINQHPVSEEEFTELGEEVLDASSQEDSSYFELVTVMALTHFSRRDCDAIVLEAGMGGVGDATNVLDHAGVVALTSVAMDHVAVLGPTLEDICRQKIGVVKPRSRVVIGPSVPLSLDNIITTTCVKNKADLIKRLLPNEEVSFDEENSRVARACVKEFFLSTQGLLVFSDDDRPPCRMQTVLDSLTKKAVVLDVGHNPAALTSLMKEITKRFVCSDGALVFAIAGDKDIKGCLKALTGRQPWRKIEFPSIENKERRFADPAELAELVKDQAKQGSMTVRHGVSIKKTMRTLLEDESINFVLVCGSHGLMKDAMEVTGNDVDDADPFDTNEKGSRDNPP